MGTFVLKSNERMIASLPIGRIAKLEAQVAALISSGGALPIQTPTGVIDGVNTTFTFTAPPSVIVADQGRVMIAGTGFTLLGTVATLDIAPTFSIFSV